MTFSASNGLRYCWRSSAESLSSILTHALSGLTSYLFLGSIVQLREHDLEGFDCFIVALCTMKRCMLQLVSVIRRRVEFDGLLIYRQNEPHLLIVATLTAVCISHLLRVE